MSWLVPSLPSLPGWSRSSPATVATADMSSADVEDTAPDAQETHEEDLDIPPLFPLANSHQRSLAPLPQSPPSFTLAPPSPPATVGEPPSDLNIAILPDPVPLGNMSPPLRTVTKPAFGIRPGGGLEANGADPATKKKAKGKVPLAPGCSALDWARLTKSGQNLNGVPGGLPLRVTMSELKRHNTPDDAWSVFYGRVYNLTPYLRFHPGGVEELMRVAGRDGTKLFQLTHSWVNLDHLLQECLVGMLVSG